MGSHIFFAGWAQIGRAVILASSAYGTLVFMLRVAGKRTLSKLNVFDFVFVVALGSTLAQTILSSDVTLADGVIALTTLISVQLLLSWVCVVSHRANRIVNGEPVLLLYRGQFLWEIMRRARVTEEEIRAAVRNQGFSDMAQVNAVVLETDGTFSVVADGSEGPTSTLSDVAGNPVRGG